MKENSEVVKVHQDLKSLRVEISLLMIPLTSVYVHVAENMTSLARMFANTSR